MNDKLGKKVYNLLKKSKIPYSLETAEILIFIGKVMAHDILNTKEIYEHK